MVTESEYNKWVDKVIDFIKEVGREINLPASSMQSPMLFNQEIDVVFLGHDAHETPKNPNWSFQLDDESIQYIKKRFKDGNYTWAGRSNDPSWLIWNNLYGGFKKIGATSLLNDDRLIFTNAVFFTGDKIEQVNYKTGKAVDACMKFTSELIFDIIKPKLLVCLSIDDVFTPLSNNSEKRFNIILGKFKPKGSKHNVILAEHKGVRIAGIPHTSGAHGVLGSMTAIAEYLKNCMTMPTVDDIVMLYKTNSNSIACQTTNKKNEAKERRRENAKAIFENLLKNGIFCMSPQGSGFKPQSVGLRHIKYGYEIYTNDVLPEAVQIFTENDDLGKILTDYNFCKIKENKYVLSSAQLEKITVKAFVEKILTSIDNKLATK